MPKAMSKAELKRRIAAADHNGNHFAQLRSMIAAIVEYLDDLKVK